MINRRRVLVLGNGFDLAHGLHTRYTDFLNFVYLTKFGTGVSWDHHNTEWLQDTIKALTCDDASYPEIELFNRFKVITESNLFIEHFINQGSNYGNNWVDFEECIRDIIIYVQKRIRDPKNIDKEFGLVFPSFDNEYEHIDLAISNNIKAYDIRTEKDVSAFLQQQLDDLKEAFLIYLRLHVEHQNIIREIRIVDDIGLSENDIVLSFNYTSTFERIYGERIKCHVYHVHGALYENNASIVMGIDGKRNREDIKTAFLPFLKTMQIVNMALDVSLLNELEHLNDIEIHFYGHSMDRIDRHILEKLLKKKDIDIYLYPLDNYDKKEKNGNITKYLGDEKLFEMFTQNRLHYRLLDSNQFQRG